MLVDGTVAVDTPGRECPREDWDLRPQAGATRPAGVSVGGGDAGLPRCPPFMLPGGSFRLCPLGGSSSVGAANPTGPVVAGGPLARVGRCLHFFMTL